MDFKYIAGAMGAGLEGDEGHITIVATFPDYKSAFKGCKQLPPGDYCLLSVLRPRFTVRESQRVVRSVVDWGESASPRVRAAGSKRKGGKKGGKGKGNGPYVAQGATTADEAPAF